MSIIIFIIFFFYTMNNAELNYSDIEPDKAFDSFMEIPNW